MKQKISLAEIQYLAMNHPAVVIGREAARGRIYSMENALDLWKPCAFKSSETVVSAIYCRLAKAVNLGKKIGG